MEQCDCPPGPPVLGRGDRAPACHPPGSQTSLRGEVCSRRREGAWRKVRAGQGSACGGESACGLLRALPHTASQGQSVLSLRYTRASGDGLGGHADFHEAAGGRPGSPVATPE